MLNVGRRSLRMIPLLAAIALSYLSAFLLRFEFIIPDNIRSIFRIGILIFLPLKLLVYWAFRIHLIRWRLLGIVDLCRILAANVVGSIFACTATLLIVGAEFPRSVYILDAILCFLATAGLQSTARFYWDVLLPQSGKRTKNKSILIYGAGVAGAQLAKEIRSNQKLGTGIAGFLDDDPKKLHGTLLGFSILGSGRDAARLVARFERRNRSISEIIIAMPSANNRQMREAIANCRAAGVPFKTLPSVSELLSGKVSRQIREVSTNDLLGREPVNIDAGKIGATLSGQSVLVTGGCGSIGSELCRQIAKFAPKKLVIFDQAESEMFMLALDLTNRHPGIGLITEIGDITREEQIESAIVRHGVSVVFHAAAYKHVPLMETHVAEAIRNNVFGTYNVARAAHKCGVKKFVLISSDKAVNPTSVMGLTKRIAEILISAMPLDDELPRCAFVAVRFGNVLGSSGSVVQIFQKQIAAGGPVTITHPEMRRYFMSISEAVQLVLQASTMGEGSEVFVLDMGEPVLISELAHNMIRLAGMVPNEDIEIRTTGLRPGEKLFEELQLSGENILPTHHEKIKRFRSTPLDGQRLFIWLEKLQILLQTAESEALKLHLAELVPEYQGLRKRMSQTFESADVSADQEQMEEVVAAHLS